MAAARLRFGEGELLAAHGHSLGAVYLFGYAIEMTLKAGYFRLAGHGDTQPITARDLYDARVVAPTLGVTWFGNLHCLECWAQLIVATRNAHPTLTYTNPSFGDEVLN